MCNFLCVIDQKLCILNDFSCFLSIYRHSLTFFHCYQIQKLIKWCMKIFVLWHMKFWIFNTFIANLELCTKNRIFLTNLLLLFATVFPIVESVLFRSVIFEPASMNASVCVHRFNTYCAHFKNGICALQKCSDFLFCLTSQKSKCKHTNTCTNTQINFDYKCNGLF